MSERTKQLNATLTDAPSFTPEDAFAGDARAGDKPLTPDLLCELGWASSVEEALSRMDAEARQRDDDVVKAILSH